MSLLRFCVGFCLFVTACAPGEQAMSAPAEPVRHIALVQGDERDLVYLSQDLPRADVFHWVSSDPRVVSVTDDGHVMGNAPGTATLEGREEGALVRVVAKVSTASLTWSTIVPLAKKTFLTVAGNEWVVAKTVADSTCGHACPGEAFFFSDDGKQVGRLSDVGRVVAGDEIIYLERAGNVYRYDFAAQATYPVSRGNLLALQSDERVYIGYGSSVGLYGPDGTLYASQAFSSAVNELVAFPDGKVVARVGRTLVLADGGFYESDLPIQLWLAESDGGVVFADHDAYTFTYLSPRTGPRLLEGHYSVVSGKEGFVQSSGLTASLAVPVVANADGAAVFLQMRTYGPEGKTRTFDVEYTEGAIRYWSLGPSQCTNHTYSVAARKGAIWVAACDRIIRVADDTLDPSGPWPQPGADSGRSRRAR